MRAFACDHCGQLLCFENSHCLRCQTPLGFAHEQLALRALEPCGPEAYRMLHGSSRARYRRCARAAVAACNWLVSENEESADCLSCRLTRDVPTMHTEPEQRAFALAEGAKRRLLYQLFDLELPLAADPKEHRAGLSFVLAFRTAGKPVMTGHANGVVTLDLSECDNVHRERVRHEFGEPYRTLLGHFRHEVGHYYWDALIDKGPLLAKFRETFGDERANYGEALKRHYERKSTQAWNDYYVSAYAASHPWEDWAETFAHYLHIRDTLQTSASFGLRVSPHAQAIPPAGGKLSARASEEIAGRDFAEVVSEWLPLTYAFNAVNRSMGKDDLYPFVLAPVVIAKLSFVHALVRDLPLARELGAASDEERKPEADPDLATATAA